LECIWPGIFGYVVHHRFDAQITPDIPDIFEEFRGKRFSHLWRFGRHGFGAGYFHRRCEGRANTETLFLDTEGNIFGGFLPIELESRECNGKDGKEDNS
jgi:hypothetical protein